MLYIHPASCCDVCLDIYSWETPEQTPHAIACGHVFCKNCLTAVHPPNCPLCRRPFDVNRIKKLHVDQPASTDEFQEADLLKKLVVEFKSSEEDLVLVTTEVDAWLASRDEASFIPLRKTREAVASYRRCKQTERHLRRTRDRLQDQVDEQEKIVDEHLEEKRKNEEKYHRKLSELETKIIARDREIAHLKQELERYTLTTNRTANPLPAPPQPVSYHIPTLQQAILDSSLPHGGLQHVNGPSPTSGYPSTYPLQPITNGSGPVYPGGGYVPAANGDKSGVASATDRGHTPSRRDKGKGKERTEFYGPPAPGVQERINKGVIPGASPNSRVFPKSSTSTLHPYVTSAYPPTAVGYSHLYPSTSTSRPLDPAVDGVDPYTLSSAYVMEYWQGFGEGYNAAVGSTPAPPVDTLSPNAQASKSDTVISTTNGHSDHSTSQNDHTLLHNFPIYQAPPQPIYSHAGHDDTGTDTLRLSMSEMSIASNSTAPPSSTGRSDTSGFSENSSSIHSSHPGIRWDRDRAGRTDGRTTAPIPSTSNANIAPGLSRPPYVHSATAPIPQTYRPQTSVGNHQPEIGNNYSSWGDETESRRASGSSWGASSRGTFPDMNIRFFNQIPMQPVDDISDQGSSSSSSDNSRTPMNHIGNLGHAAPSVPPSASGTASSSRRGQYPPTPSMQILAGTHGTQSTQVLAEPEQQTHTRSRGSRELGEGDHSRRSSRHRTRQSLTSSTVPTLPVVEYDTPPVTAPVIPTTEMGYAYEPPASAVDFGNALGLDLAAPPRTAGIIAPTPRFSAQSLLRSYSSGQP